MGISGTGVAVATLGGLLVYAGLTGQNPVQALKDISTGKPKGASKSSGYTNTQVYPGLDQAVTDANLNPAASAGGVLASAVGTGPLPALPTAALSFIMDQYSQAKRNQTGFSDCSSFVGKSFRAIGITPPGGSTTGEYLVWKKLKKIPISEAGAGDLLVNSAHMAIVFNPNGSLGGGKYAPVAIGQQNTQSDVRIDSFANIMYGTGAYICLRYTG